MRRPEVTWLLGRMVSERLAIRDVAETTHCQSWAQQLDIHRVESYTDLSDPATSWWQSTLSCG